MPYKSKKQESYLRRNLPHVAKKFDKDIKKMAKKNKTTKKGNVRKAATLPGSRLAFDDTKQEKEKVKREQVAGGWIAHVKKVRKEGESWKDALKRASATYKK